MANTKKTEDGGHIIDVKRAGSTAPSSTSKPVIVTNRPILKDPMVVDDDKAADDKPANASTRKSVKPLDETMPTESAPEATKSVDQPAEPATTETASAEQSQSEPVAPPEEVPATPTEEDKPSETDDKAVDDKDGKDGGAANAEAVAQAEAEKEAAHEQEVQKLIDSKQYFLSINSVEKRRSRHFIIIGVVLSLVLVLAWADVALDAGLITIPGVKPLTHFFSN